MVLRVRVYKKRMPVSESFDKDIEWLCSSLGFCQDIDRDRTAQRIFQTIYESSMTGEPLRSDDISERVGKSRGAIVNHLNKLMDSGLVHRKGTRYELREACLEATISEMRRDMERIFEDMEKMAAHLDKRMREV